MTLNDLKKPLKPGYVTCRFRDRKSMNSACQTAWRLFFQHTLRGEPWIDVMVWNLGQVVSVRPACTAIDESRKNFRKPHPIVFEVKGFQAACNQLTRQAKAIDESSIEAGLEELHEELHASIQKQIVAALKIPSRQNEFYKWNREGHPFSVVTTTRDDGLHASEYQLIWKNEKGLSLRQIANRNKSAQGKPASKEKRKQTLARDLKDKNKERRQNEKAASKRYRQAALKKQEKRIPAARKKLETAFPIKSGHRVSKRAKRYTPPKNKSFLLSLDDGNQSDGFFVPAVKLDKLVDIQASYIWTEFDENDNRMWEYRYAFIDPVVAKERPKRLETFWYKLNRAQKVFYTFLQFLGETDNGGIWQFLFNAPQLSWANFESLQEIGANRLAEDYSCTLEEVIGNATTLAAFRKKASDLKLDSAKRWVGFVSGYDSLGSARKIESYFFTQTFKRQLYRKMSNYIEANYSSFAARTDT